VILVERHAFLGGNATAALVMPLMSFHTQRGPAAPGSASELMPHDHGPGEAVVQGALKRLLDRLEAAGGSLRPSPQTGYVVPFDPEIFKLVALDLLDDAGVRVLLHAFASGVVGAPRPDGVVFETKSGPIVVMARAIVAGTERNAFAAYRQAHPDQWRGVHGLWELVREASAAGELALAREDILFFGTPHERELSVNSTRVTGALGTSVWDLTLAEWQARRQMKQIVAFLRKYVPGFERSYLAQSGVTIGVRETRRITGEYQLTAEDILGARKAEDVIARGTYPLDIHNPTGKGTVLMRLPDGGSYDIPLRCLLPQRLDRLAVAGRCISGTHEAHSSYRVMPIAMATGQAAGVCAALAARAGKAVRDVPPGDVQTELRRQGALI